MNVKSKWHAGRCRCAPIQQLNRPAGNIFTALHYKAYKKSEQAHMTSESSIREIEVTFKWIHPCRVTEGWNLSQYALCEMEVMPSEGHRAKTDNTFTQQKCHLIRTSPKKGYANPPTHSCIGFKQKTFMPWCNPSWQPDSHEMLAAALHQIC